MAQRNVPYGWKPYQWKGKYGNFPLVNYATSWSFGWEEVDHQRVTMILKVVEMAGLVPHALWGETSDGEKVKFIHTKFRGAGTWLGKIVLVDGKWKDEESFLVEEWKVMGDNTDLGEYDAIADDREEERQKRDEEVRDEGTYEK